MKQDSPAHVIAPAPAERVRADRTRPPVLLPEAFQELQAAMQELEVAEEELRSQNEALAHAHALIEAERVRYRDLFEFAPDGCLVTDPLGVVREANRAASQLLGLSPRFLSGKPLATFVAEEDLRAFRQRLLDVGRDQAAQEWELCLRHRKKGPFLAALTLVSIPGPDGASLRWTIRDLSGRSGPGRGDQAAVLEAVLAAVPVGIALLDAQGRFIRVNEPFARWAGCSSEACAGRAAADILTADRWAAVQPLLRRGLGGEAVSEAEIAGGGPAAQCLLSSRPVVVTGRVTGITLVLREM